MTYTPHTNKPQLFCYAKQNTNTKRVLSVIKLFCRVSIVLLLTVSVLMTTILHTVANDAFATSVGPSILSVSPAYGVNSGGTEVWITGSNFTNSITAVNFGSTRALSWLVESSTLIEAASPPGTGTVNITLSVGAVASPITVSDQFSYEMYTPVLPTRICDTRPTANGTPANQCNTGSNGTLAANSTLQVNVTGAFGSTSIPSNASSVVLNVTATNTTQDGGYLTIYPTGNTLPNTSNLNFSAGDTVAHLVQVGVGTNGNISIYNFNGSTDVIVDVSGYTAPTITTTASGQFIPISPVRICDTRSTVSGTPANQCNTGSNGTLAANSTLQVNVSSAGLGGALNPVPASATAVVLNVTATNTTQDGGYLTIYPTGNTLPNASNLNFSAGDTVANRVIVPVNTTTGDISIYNFNGSTDVIVDLNGYYTGASGTLTGSVFNPVTPTRVCDTRPTVNGTPANQCNSWVDASGTLVTAVTASVYVTDGMLPGLVDNVPMTATAIVANVTATNTTSNGGFFTLYPTPSNTLPPVAPNVSDLNWSQGETVSNLAIVKLGVALDINVYNAIGSADLIVDVMGYYA